MKRPPIKNRPGWVVIDVDGRICWGLAYDRFRDARAIAMHPMRRVVRCEVVMPKKRKRARKP